MSIPRKEEHKPMLRWKISKIRIKRKANTSILQGTRPHLKESLTRKPMRLRHRKRC
jgi:hypothetical protein